MNELDPSDVILWLLPHRGEGFDGAAFATAKPENKSRFVAARHDSLKQRNIPREERAGTELPVEYGLFKNTDCLVLLFSHAAKTSVGVVGGCAINADFSLQDIPGVSKYHFAITFDEQNRPILRDLGSTGGTKVTYNGEEGQRLSNFDWPLVGPSIADGKPPILNITDLLQFKVIVPDHDYTSPEYIDKVKKFRTGTADPENLFASLIIQSAQGTQLPSGQQTPSRGPRSRPILYKKQIGEGNYGVVIYMWSLTTREEYIVKQPLPKLIRSRNFAEKTWRKEAEIMRSVSHEHIVAFRDASFSPYPKLEFEYIRGGSLDSYTDLSTFENTQVLSQLSSALEYLHNRNPSIGHRDIKPENILVVYRREVDGIYVKFADFGLSKAADILKTCCEYEEEWTTDAVAWIHALQSHVNDNYYKQGSKLLYLITDSMLMEDPDDRSSADYVNTEAVKLLQSMANESDDEGSATSTPSILSAQSVVGPEGLNENSEGADVTDPEEDWEWLEALGPETRQSQVLETTEVVPQGSTVDGSLWNAGDPEGASFASSDGSQATELGTVEAAQTEEVPQEEEDHASLVAGYLLGGDKVQGDEGEVPSRPPGQVNRCAREAGQRETHRCRFPGLSQIRLRQTSNVPPAKGRQITNGVGGMGR